MRRRWRLRVFWAAVVLGVLLLATLGTIVQAIAAVRRPKSWRVWGPYSADPTVRAQVI